MTRFLDEFGRGCGTGYVTFTSTPIQEDLFIPEGGCFPPSEDLAKAVQQFVW